VTNSGQAVTASLMLSAFGQAVASSGSSSSPYQYGATSGYRTEGDAGLTLVGCRFYDPQFGCFLTRDTELDQLPYAYCDGDPVNCTDPDGHKVVFDPVKFVPSNGVTLSVSFHSGTSFSGMTSLSGITTGQLNSTTTTSSLFGGTLNTTFHTGQGPTTFSGSYFHQIYGPIGFMDTFGTGNRNRLFLNLYNRNIEL